MVPPMLVRLELPLHIIVIETEVEALSSADDFGFVKNGNE